MPPLSADDQRLLDALPPDAALAMTRALNHVWLSLEEVTPILASAERRGMPADTVARYRQYRAGLDLTRSLLDCWFKEIPPVETLRPEQRAFMGVVALHPELKLDGFPLAGWARWSMRRWLGLDPAGALEQIVDIGPDGGSQRVPRWQALVRSRSDPDRRCGLLAKLPMVERLEVYGELDAGGYGFAGGAFPGIDELRDQGREWAPRHADWLLSLTNNVYGAPQHPEMQRLLSLSLVRSGTTIERRWEVFVPERLDAADQVGECVGGLPESRRPAVLSRMLKSFLWSTVFGPKAPVVDPGVTLEKLLPLFEKYPPAGVTDEALKGYTARYHLPKREVLAAVAALAKRFPVLAPGLKQDRTKKPPKLTVEPRPLPPQGELTAIERQQFAKLDDRTYELLERFELTDASSDRRYHAILNAGGDGHVFASGTAEVVAMLAQDSADGEDGLLSEAIDKAFGAYRKKAAAGSTPTRAGRR
jgi:hypothetical protein